MAISGVGVRELPEAHTFDFIEETFRHSLGPRVFRGIAPLWEREGVAEPFLSPMGGIQARPPWTSRSGNA